MKAMKEIKKFIGWLAGPAALVLGLKMFVSVPFWLTQPATWVVAGYGATWLLDQLGL